MSIDKILESKIGIITLISIIFEIVKIGWTIFIASPWGEDTLITTLYVIGLLIIDYMVIKSLILYLMGLSKNNVSNMKTFKYGLDSWIICLLISGFSTITFYTHLQIGHHFCNNYLISKYFSKRIPFYLSIICNIISGLHFYYNAKKYNGFNNFNEKESQSKPQPQTESKSKSQSKSQSELISSIISQSEKFSDLISQLKNNIQS